MRLPRDVSGQDLARRLGQYGYAITRQTGSHLKLTSNQNGREHSVTFTTARLLRMATLNNILVEIAAYLAIDKDSLSTTLFT